MAYPDRPAFRGGPGIPQATQPKEPPPIRLTPTGYLSKGPTVAKPILAYPDRTARAELVVGSGALRRTVCNRGKGERETF